MLNYTSIAKENAYIACANGIGIRPFKNEDLIPFHQALNESYEHMFHYVPTGVSAYTENDARNWLESLIRNWQNGREYTLGIFLVDTGEFLGSICIESIDFVHRFANFGYWVKKSAIQKGIATTATKLTAKFAFDILKLARLEIFTDLNNIPAQRIAEKIGAKKEGILRKRAFHHGSRHDAVMYGLLPDDLLPL